jgi:hypothetical protein
MTASFDKQELMAGLAELEKRVREHRPSNDRPAAAPGDRLDLDLAAIEAALKAKSAAKPAANAAPSVEIPRDAQRSSRKLDVAPELRASSRAKEGAPVPPALEAVTLRVDDPRDLARPARSATTELVAQKDPAGPTSAKLSAPGAIAIENATRIAGDWSELPPPPPPPPQSVKISPAAKTDLAPDSGLRAAAPAAVAPKRPHRWIYAAAAILIVVGTLVVGAGWLVSGKVLAALKEGSSSAPKAMAAVPAPELNAETAPTAPPVAAQETASATPVAAVEAAPEAPAQAVQAAEAAPAAAPVPPSAAAPPPAKAVAAVEQPAAAAPSPTSDAPAAKPAKPAKKPKKATADKPEDKADKDAASKSHAKPKADKIVKLRSAPETSAPLPPPQPQALAAPPPPASPPPAPVAANPESGVLARAGQAVGSITGTVKGWVGLDSGAHSQ